MSNYVRIALILLIAYVLLVGGIVILIHLTLAPTLPVQLIAPLV